MKITQHSDYQILALECLKGSNVLYYKKNMGLVIFEQNNGLLSTVQLGTKALYSKMDLQNQIEANAKHTKNVNRNVNQTVKSLLNADVIGKDDALVLKDICEKAQSKEDEGILTK